MSDATEHYRRMAHHARAEAEAAVLPNVRQLHLRSAERLEQIVAGIENVLLAKARNDEAKRGEVSAAV